MSTLLTVDLLPSFLANHEVAALFAWCPGFLRSGLVLNAQGRSAGSAVLEVSTPGDAQRIIQTMDGVEIAGAAIRVSRLEGPPEERSLWPPADEAGEAGRKIRDEVTRQPPAHQRAIDELSDE
jgi:RNA recognition motif-containing protein